jgi:hypothetical protein
MEDDATIIVRTFFSEDEAESARQYLQANGIEAYVTKPNVGGEDASGLSCRNVRLLVPDCNVDRVFEIIEPLGIE